LKPIHHSEEEFLKIIRSNPAGYTTVEIANRVGVERKTAIDRLHKLEQEKKIRSLPVGRRLDYTRNLNPRTLIWIMPPDPIPRLVKAVARELYPEQFKKQI
jgi:DNA-binding Lrp family transcriptional regulator